MGQSPTMTSSKIISLTMSSSKTVLLLCLVLQLVAVTESSFLTPPQSPLPFPAATTTATQRRVDSVILFAKSGKRKKHNKGNTICVNRQARRNFEILETLEAGISLLGTEVKSIRDGKMNLQDAFVKTNYDGRGCTLMNCHIGKHSMSASYFNHEERRPRPLLVHKKEALKFQQKTEQSGMTIVPLKAYFNDDNKIKIQIAICRGKNVRDKRADIKERESKRETNRIMKNFRL
jgi:SsrA-binding protein